MREISEMATESLMPNKCSHLPLPTSSFSSESSEHERAIDPLISSSNHLQSVSSTSFELQISEQHSVLNSNNSTPQQLKHSNKHQQQQQNNVSVTSSGGALSTTSASSSNGTANSRFSAIRNWLKQNRWRKQKSDKHSASANSSSSSTNATLLMMGSPNSTPISSSTNKNSLISSLTSPFQQQQQQQQTNTNSSKKSNSDNKHYKTGSNVSTPNNNVKTQLNSKYLVLFLLIFPFLFPFFFFINSISTTLFFSLPLFQLLIIIIIFLVSNLGGFFLCVLLQFMNSFVLFLID